MSLVSVIVPVYNVEKYLAECLKSILGQTFQEIEVICVNDVTPDNSVTILEEYAQKDKRIRIIHHEQNGGLGAARNTGVFHATSPYIAFVDSDDYIEPEFIKTLYQLIDDNDAQMSWCGSNLVSVKSQFLSANAISARDWHVEELMNEPSLYPSILPVWNKMFRRELIKDIKQLPIISEDQPALAKYFTRCRKIVTTDLCLYNYRQNENTLSKPKDFKKELWNDFFYSHGLFFNTLNEHFNQRMLLRKQSVLRNFSMLWRVKTFDLIDKPGWKDHKPFILKHVRENKTGLKQYCPVLYWHIVALLSVNFSRSKQHFLVKTLASLAKHRWVKRSGLIYYPLDVFWVFRPYLKVYLKQILNGLERSLMRMMAFIHTIIQPSPIWLLGERPDTAQDNGYYLFRYLCESQPHVKAYYVIDKRSVQYRHVKDVGRTIQYNSFKHKLFFLRCSHYLTSHNHYCIPTYLIDKKRYRFNNKTKNVFLQHGITFHDNSNDYGKEKAGFSYFICGAKPEFEFIKKEFGYRPNQVKLTGFARFDGLHNISTRNEILLMPTWRKSIWENRQQNNHAYFLKSAYYKTFQSLINHPRLLEMLETYHYRLIFYPHYEIQPYLNAFSSKSDLVQLASKENHHVQELLKAAKLLITDSSSVSFDFGYMFKPLIYYFFDQEDFKHAHLKPAYFSRESMGFGEVIDQEDELVKQIAVYLDNDCRLNDQFRERVELFFPLNDMHNCERIYQSLQEVE